MHRAWGMPIHSYLELGTSFNRYLERRVIHGHSNYNPSYGFNYLSSWMLHFKQSYLYNLIKMEKLTYPIANV